MKHFDAYIEKILSIMEANIREFLDMSEQMGIEKEHALKKLSSGIYKTIDRMKKNGNSLKVPARSKDLRERIFRDLES